VTTFSAKNTVGDDNVVVLHVLAGNTEQFNELVLRYQTPLLRLAFTKLGDIALAEDVVQETFLAAFKSLHTYNSAFSFRTWLWTILLNQCRRHGARRQKKARTQDSDSLAEEMPSSDPSPSRQAMLREQARQLANLLRRLPDVQADALRLRFFGGLKFAEIAAVMECSLSSAKGRVRTGLEKISCWLAEPSAQTGQSQLEQE
jgi:RNA polymerase sigma-70 factor (ECF subfamily)